MSKPSNNIERYRQQRRRQRLIRRIVAAVLVLLFGAACLWGYRVYSSREDTTMNQESRSSGFPVKLKGDAVQSARMMGSAFALLTDREFSLYNSKGSTVRSVSHGYFNPSMKTSSKRALLYDIGGTKFSVESKAGEIASAETENKILFGEIAENGNVVLVTSDDRYQNRLTVYNQNGIEIWRWYSAQNLVVALDFVDGGDGCVVAAVTTDAGQPRTTIYGLDFSKGDEEVFSAQVSGSLAFEVSVKSGGAIHLIADNALIVLSDTGEEQSRYEYPKTLMYCDSSPSKYTVLLFGEEVKSNHTVTVLDTGGKTVSSAEFNTRVRGMFSDGSHVVLLTDKQIVCYNMLMKQGKTLDDQSDISLIAGKGGTGYRLNNSKLEKFPIS
ncbi:hypothetical protein CLOSTMETH_02876 [[Clostridium] methylpentosum DSM 5476]|uniref:Uncharacterized protein n=1 Tax=[Clostridium] methylpentosum DSM 5476 TaxID=537013 RepID=C0EG83_9FIRM|nr:hypothetical protein CLOSTMETH_02876 [[Clostridium] methylpentosum DSM 5476]MDY3988501.1 DUF5711 family protein [Massilioclostridium sp.]MEE1492653.1 DUF5711 family protein [Massilioclostridium sp.]